MAPPIAVRDASGTAIYRPNCHYAYHPADDAVLSLHEMFGRAGKMQEPCDSAGLEWGAAVEAKRLGSVMSSAESCDQDAKGLAGSDATNRPFSELTNTPRVAPGTTTIELANGV